MTKTGAVPDAGRSSARARSAASRRTIDTARRDARAADLRAGGWTWSQVAADLGVSRQHAARMAKRCLRDAAIPAAEAMLATEDARLDYAEAKLRWNVENPGPIVSGGKEIAGTTDVDRSTWAADALRRVFESRRKLHGWDAPTQRYVTISDARMNAEIERTLAELGIQQPAPAAIDNVVEAVWTEESDASGLTSP